MDLLQRLSALVGANGLAADPTPYLTEPRGRFPGATPLVLRPATTEEVAAIMAACAQEGVPVVAQGGNTGLVGGQIPNGPEILISFDRMTAVRKVDAANDTMVVEAGVTLAAAQAAAEAHDRLFPLSLAAEGTATIGGAVSTNAGGVAVLRYGNMRDLVLGLEVVLPDGRIWNGLNELRKDNTGYDLKQLFLGAEGTLGLVTAVVLKLFPQPRDSETAFIGLKDVDAAVALLGLAKALSGGRVTSFELMPRIAIEFLLRHLPGARDPLAEPHPWYVLMTLDSGDAPGPLRKTIETILAEAADVGLIEDGAIAGSLAQAQEFWRLRESFPDIQKAEGGSIKHDISVPVSRIAQFIARADAAVRDLVKDCRPVPFGHVGDGNIHFNISQPVGADKEVFLARWPELAAVVHDIAHELGGSFSAEHGVGQLKRADLRRYKDPVALDLMMRIKSALDPDGLLNPGKIL